MTKPIKLTKDRQGESFYPATTTDAVVDKNRAKALSEILDDIDKTITNSDNSKKILYLELEKLEEFGEWSEEVDGVLNRRNICQIPVDIFKQEFGVNTEDFHQYTHVCDGYYGVTVPLSHLEEGSLLAIALHYGSSDTYNTMQFMLYYDDEFVTITYDEYCIKSALYFIKENNQAYLKPSAESGTVASVLVPKVGNQGGEMVTKLFVKHDAGWEPYEALKEQSVTTDKVADGAITLDKLSEYVQEAIAAGSAESLYSAIFYIETAGSNPLPEVGQTNSNFRVFNMYKKQIKDYLDEIANCSFTTNPPTPDGRSVVKSMQVIWKKSDSGEIIILPIEELKKAGDVYSFSVPSISDNCRYRFTFNGSDILSYYITVSTESLSLGSNS